MRLPIQPANLARLANEASAEKARRVPAQTQLKVFTFTADDETYITLPGTCTIALGLGREPQFEALYHGMQAHDSEALRSVAAQLQKTADPSERDSVELDELVETVKNATTLVDVSYGEKQLLANAPMSDSNRLAIIPMPYNGGNLDPARFRMASYSHDQSENLSGFVVLHQPKVSELERSVIELIPADAADFHLASFGPVAATPATLVVATAAATAMHTPFLGGRLAAEDISRRLDLATLSDDQVRELGDLGSAERLLELRREALWS